MWKCWIKRFIIFGDFDSILSKFSSGKFTENFYSNNGLRVLAICSSILGWGKIRWNLNVYFFHYAELNICLYICWQSVPLKWIICSHSLSVFLLGFCLISHCGRRFLGVSNEPCLVVSMSLFPSPLKLGVLRWPASADRVRAEVTLNQFQSSAFRDPRLSSFGSLWSQLPGNRSSHHDTTILSEAQSSHMDKPQGRKPRLQPSSGWASDSQPGEWSPWKWVLQPIPATPQWWADTQQGEQSALPNLLKNQ